MIESIKEDFRGTSLSSTTDSGSLTRRFSVTVTADTDPVAAQIEVKTAPGLPQEWDLHPYSNWHWVTSVSVSPLSVRMYNVDVVYSYEKDPLNQPAKWGFSFSKSNEPIDRDIEGKPLTNTADESFDPPITRDVSDLVVTAEMNVSQPSPNDWQNMIDTLNQYEFIGFPARTMLLKNISATPQRFGNTDLEYYTVSFEFHIRNKWETDRDPWDRRILNEGYREKTGTEDGKPTYTTIKDTSGQPLSQPTQLDADGKKLADNADPVFIDAKLYPDFNFSNIGLGV